MVYICQLAVHISFVLKYIFVNLDCFNVNFLWNIRACMNIFFSEIMTISEKEKDKTNVSSSGSNGGQNVSEITTEYVIPYKTKRDVIFVIDVSDTTNMISMNMSLIFVKLTIKAWERRYNALQIGIILFSNRAQEKISLADFKNDNKLLQKIRRINRKGGSSKNQSNGKFIDYFQMMF